MTSVSYSKLRGRMRECGFTQKALAAALRMAESTLCLKLAGRYAFTADEIQEMIRLLDIGQKEIGPYFFVS